MKNSFGLWESQIASSSLDSVINYILTNNNAETIEYKTDCILHFVDADDYGKPLSVLDFGCGVCRNAIAIAKQLPNWNIVGYDNQNMLNQAANLYRLKLGGSINEVKNLQLESNWDKLKLLKFDIIYANLVFQHIKEKDLRLYLSHIKQMTNTLIVYGRRFNDDIKNGENKNTWKILEKNGFFPENNERYSLEGKPKEHFGVIYKIL